MGLDLMNTIASLQAQALTLLELKKQLYAQFSQLPGDYTQTTGSILGRATYNSA